MNIASGLTAVFEKAGNDFIGYIEEMPRCRYPGCAP